MPRWQEWRFEYIGSRFLGRLLGLWWYLWALLVLRLFRVLAKAARNRRDASYGDPNRRHSIDDIRPSGTEFSFARRLSWMTVSTLATLGVWKIITIKTVWIVVGESGDRMLAAVLLFVSASWITSLVWICLFPSRKRNSQRRPLPVQTQAYRIR